MPATKPISERRLAANRANALRSTGPRTAEGKARSARNAHKHGLASTSPVTRLDEIADLETFRVAAIAFYRPANSEELFAVERIAQAQLAISHCAALEAGLLSDAMSHSDDPNPSLALAIGFQHLVAGSDSFKLFLRYQAQAERQYRRAVEDFVRLRAFRDEFPNEAIHTPQPHTNEPLAPPTRDPLTPASRVFCLPPPQRCSKTQPSETLISDPTDSSAPSAISASSGFDFDSVFSASPRLSGEMSFDPTQQLKSK